MPRATIETLTLGSAALGEGLAVATLDTSIEAVQPETDPSMAVAVLMLSLEGVS